jgi:type I restriction enzyme, S subunit
MKGWITQTIGELCDAGRGKVQTGPFGSQLHESDYSDVGTPVVMPKNIQGSRIEEEGIARVSESHVFRLRRHKLANGDIVYGRRGDIGRQALIKDEYVGWLCGTGCLRITLGKAPVTPQFLHRYLQLSDVIRWIECQAIGATMPNLNTSILRRIPVTFPFDARTQLKITMLLSTFDELIESHSRRIVLLEKLAEEIYREWFVRLRFPGHERLKKLKGVPQGWELLPFSELVKLNPPERVEKSEEIPFVAMEDLSVSSMYFAPKETRKGGQGSKFKNRDILFPRITPSMENGKRGFVMTLADGQIGFGSTEFIVMREKIIGPEHIYFLTCSPAFRKHAELSMTGASGRQRVQEECFSFFLIKTPPAEIRGRFSELVRPHFSQINLLSRGINQLTGTRDLLLPRLLSGKLSVENLDTQLPPGMAEQVNDELTASTHA